jgi:hypothetical protein
MTGPRILSKALLVAILACTCMVGAARAATDFRARVTWEPSWGSIGYRVYLKPAAGDWDAGTDVGMPPLAGNGTMSWTVTCTLAGLPLGGDMSFRVAGYDAQGNESTPSNEITVDEAAIVAAITPLDLPLADWAKVAGSGDFSAQAVPPVDDLPGEALVLATDRVPATVFGVGSPSFATLAQGRSQLAVSLASDQDWKFLAVVTDARGRRRKIAWVSGEGVAYVERNIPTFPLGAGLVGTGVVGFTRDLRADLLVGLGETFAGIDQVQVFGNLALRRVRLNLEGAGGFVSDPPGVFADAPTTGWRSNSKTLVEQGLYDPDLGKTTIRATVGSLVPKLSYPAKASTKLIAPFRQLKIPVRDIDIFSVEAQLVLDDGRTFRMLYATDVAEVTVTRTLAKFPLPAPLDVPGSPWDALVVRLATDLEVLQSDATWSSVVPAAKYAGVQRMTLKGGFWAGPVRLEDRIE